jgi:hypothetical protein
MSRTDDRDSVSVGAGRWFRVFDTRRRFSKQRNTPRLQSKRLAFECLEERRVLAVQAFPLPLESVAPDGALIYQGTATATIDDSAEVESFTIDLDAGQSISLLVTPNESLEAELVLHTPGGFSTGIFGPGAPGEPVLLNDFQITQAGTYTFDVSGEPGLNGAFDLRLVVGAALEAETVTGDSNDTVVAAQPIAIGEVMSGSGRGAVLGQLASGTTDDDWYAFDLDDGAAATIVLDSATPGAATLELYHSDGTTLVALGTADSDSQQAIRGFADATSDTLPDTYFLRVSGADTDYRGRSKRRARNGPGCVAAGKRVGTRGIGKRRFLPVLGRSRRRIGDHDAHTRRRGVRACQSSRPADRNIRPHRHTHFAPQRDWQRILQPYGARERCVYGPRV